MKNTSRLKFKIKALTLLSIILITSLFGMFLMNFINIPSSLEGSTIKNDQDNELFEKNKPIASLGTHSWWDKSFHSRRVINITNPNSETFYNYGVSISFNYTTDVLNGDLRADLGDLRIIEYDSGGDAFQRKYYFQKDYPQSDIVSVWFETNITVSDGDSQLDTYLYFGNDAVGINTTYFMNETTSDSVANNFGWIRNGNFEQDPGVGGHAIDGVFGWYFADDVPDDVNGAYTPNTPDPDYYQHNLSTMASNQELQNEGAYTFKFGDISHDVSSGSTGKDIAGTLFSAPFVVPTVSGGSNKIYINAWRNFRTFDDQNSKKIGVYVRIAQYYDDTNVNSHGAYGGSVYTQGYVEFWDSFISESSLKTWVEDPFGILADKNTAAGQLTGDLLIDVSDYQGEAIFLEFGMLHYDIEAANKFNAFAQVDNVTFTYNFDVSLDSEAERRKSDVTIIVRDIDGRIVPNAEVSLINSSKPVAEQIQYGPLNTSEEEGSITFTGVTYSTYNYTVNYTIPSTGYEFVVFNSSSYPLVYFNITESQQTFTIYIDIWTIDFEIVDYDKESLNYAYIAVYNETKMGVNLENITLNSDGKGTFRWRNQSSYYYEVYYDNIDYNLNPTALNESYVKRATYDQANDKYRDHSFLINETNADPAGNPTFAVNELIYTNGSRTELGNKKILGAEINITFQTSDAYLTSVSIYYIDKNNYTDDNYLIYYNNSYDADFLNNRINMDMRFPQITPSSLITNNYEVYGLKIVAIGANTTNFNGVFNITLNETTNIYNVTDLSKLNIRVVNEAGGGLVGGIVIVNSSIGIQNFQVNLTAAYSAVDYLNGYAYGTTNNLLPFWYLRGYEYNISLYYAGEYRQLNVTVPDPFDPQYPGIDWRDEFNYTLNGKSNFTIEPNLGGVDPNWFQLQFNNIELVDVVTWGNNFSVRINFTLTDDNWASSLPVTLPATVTCYVKSTGPSSTIVSVKSMVFEGNGMFNTTFNSSIFSAGGGGELYSIIISGNKPSYNTPSNFTDTIFVESVQTTLSMHDYYNSLNIISTDSQIYGESLNLTFSFYNVSLLTGATLTFEWLSFDPIQFYGDPVNDGYYTTTIDTSLSGSWGAKSIKIIAMLENYTTQIIFMTLSITERPTTLNEEIGLVYLSSQVWVQDPNPFNFTYTDVLTNGSIGDLTSATYVWEQLYPNGTRIPGTQGSGILVQNNVTDHILDFKTELKEIGNYYLYATLHKQNYKPKSALINLEILSREFSYTLQPGKIVDGIMTIENGDSIDLSISLQDLTRNIKLQGATVSMSYQSATYNFTEGGSGSYSVNITDYTRLNEDATSDTSTTSIIISKANFTTQIIETTIVLNNRRFDIIFSDEVNENLAKIVSGNRLTFIVTLFNSNDQSQVIDATITLTINDQPYEDLIIINNGDGTYTFEFLSYPTAFVTSNTLSGEISIARTNYKTENIPITIQINMEEIFPGMPTFYFILITASIIGVVGSIVAYRVVQQARIPKHVKKIRKIKGLIKSKKKIPETISIHSKSETIAKLFGDDWRGLGISINEALGIKDLKKKLPTIAMQDKKQRISKQKVQKEKAEAKSIRDKEKQIKKEADAKIKEENAKKAAELKAIKDKEKLAQKEADAKIKEENAKKAAELKAIKDKEKLAQKEAELKAKKEKDEESAKGKAEQKANKEKIDKATLEKIPEKVVPEEKIPEEVVPEDEIPRDETKEERGEND